MEKLALGIVALVAVAFVIYHELPDDGPTTTLKKWRAVLAGLLFAILVTVAAAGRIDADMYLCDKTTVTTRGPEGRSTEVTRSCEPPIGIPEAAFLLLPIVALIAPALSEFGVAGVFSAKLRAKAEAVVEETVQQILVTHRFEQHVDQQVGASQDPMQLQDLPPA